MVGLSPLFRKFERKIIFFLLIAFPILTAAVRAASVERVEGVAAQVGGEIVLLSEVQKMAAPIALKLLEQGGTIEDLVKTHEQALDRLIEQALIRQVIRQAELSASDSEIDAAIAGIAGDNNITASELRTSVEKQGLSFSEYREKIGDELEQHKVIQGMVMSKIRIDEEELKTIYENEYAQETGEGLEVQISQILIPRAADSEACDKVRAARERVVAGEPFPLVASQTSYVNPNGGGSLGWTSVSDLIGWMRDLAETLPPGAMSEVVELPHACSVLVVTDRRDASERSFGDVRDKIARAVRRERSDEQYRLFIDDMRSRTYIDRRTTFKPEDFRISDE